MAGDKSNVLIALVGRSGAGKSVSAKYLEDIYGLKYLRSYTTREKRADKLDDHTYVNLVQYSRITGKVAENHYTGNWYCATESQCDDADVYVVDVPGLKQLKENYHKKHILALCIDTPNSTRIQRMKDRGDTSDAIDERMKKDESAFEEVYDLCDAVINNEGSLSMTCLNIMAELERFKRQIRDTEGATTETVDQNN